MRTIAVNPLEYTLIKDHERMGTYEVYWEEEVPLYRLCLKPMMFPDRVFHVTGKWELERWEPKATHIRGLGLRTYNCPHSRNVCDVITGRPVPGLEQQEFKVLYDVEMVMEIALRGHYEVARAMAQEMIEQEEDSFLWPLVSLSLHGEAHA